MKHAAPMIQQPSFTDLLDALRQVRDINADLKRQVREIYDHCFEMSRNQDGPVAAAYDDVFERLGKLLS